MSFEFKTFWSRANSNFTFEDSAGTFFTCHYNNAIGSLIDIIQKPQVEISKISFVYVRNVI